VTESKRDNAQVQVETAIRLDKKQFEKAGLSLNAQDGSSTHVSPMAGECLAIYPTEWRPLT
jgi:cysteine desulfurase